MTDARLQASVIISTRNRADILPRLFDALARMVVSTEVVWELLLVDNGSNDATADAIRLEIAQQRLPIRLLSEPIPGKSRALNRAIRQARGELLIFTDDDVEPEPGWLQAYVDAAAEQSRFDGFAGRVLPKWLGPIPTWLHTDGPFAVPRGISNTRDFGQMPHVLDANVIPGGVNTALRREAVARNGWFREELGPGTAVPFTEDTDYMRRFRNGGGEFYYLPVALLYHCNVPQRMSKAYLCHWTFEVARCQVLAFAGEAGGTTLMDVPLYLWRQWLSRLFWCLEPREQPRLRKKMQWMFSAGSIAGYRQLRAFRNRCGRVEDTRV